MKIRRIVVGLDIAPHSGAALAAAARLARELDAELDALFVEDEALLRLAALPFAREFGLASATARRLDPAALARDLASRAESARRELGRLWGDRPARWSLRVTRGTTPEAVRAEAGEADLSVLGVARWGPEARRRAHAGGATVLVPARAGARGPLVALCPVERDPAQAAALLVSLANAVGDGLVVLAIGANADLEAARRWCGEVDARLREARRPARLEIVRADQPEALDLALERLAPRAVALVSAGATP